jgi:hypothetical protein
MINQDERALCFGRHDAKSAGYLRERVSEEEPSSYLYCIGSHSYPKIGHGINIALSAFHTLLRIAKNRG